ncbi:signal peptidase II [Salinarimonas chemoclinalis]|uniref:signal peptidase II n=1 Tax=Salinarimonas chemoclinalis TaxID=3241599 RepID=UPI0035564E42
MPAPAAPTAPRPPTHRRLALSLVLAIFLADQATKLFFLFVHDLRVHAPLEIAPFAELIVVWNRGISYGLLQQETELGRWLLVAGSLGAAAGLGIWMLRTGARALAASLALVVGGALGNVVDRIAYGAVFDFVHLHLGAFSWYVFNVADAAIVAGVVGLLYDSFVLEPRRARRAPARRGTPPHESRDGG